MRILGVDPGSRLCGYGVIDVTDVGGRGAAVAGGVGRVGVVDGGRARDVRQLDRHLDVRQPDSDVREPNTAARVRSSRAPGAGSRYAYVECGVLTADARLPMERRLGEIARWLTDVITELRPVVVAVEDVFTHINQRSALALAQARGMVLAVTGMAGLSVYSYPPALVKKTVTGRGRAPKDQVARMVQALVGLRQVPRADAADALAVAITHAQRTALADRIAGAERAAGGAS